MTDKTVDVAEPEVRALMDKLAASERHNAVQQSALRAAIPSQMQRQRVLENARQEVASPGQPWSGPRERGRWPADAA